MADDEDFLRKPKEWWAEFERLRRRIGLPAAIIFVLSVCGILIWWNWDSIVTRPWVGWFVDICTRQPVPRAPAGRLSIVVTHLEGDSARQIEKLLLDDLRQFKGVEILEVDRTVEWPGSGTEHEKKAKAQDEARTLLKNAGADAVMWGSVLSFDTQRAIRIYWTEATDLPGAKGTERYQIESVGMPMSFWSDLKQVLGLLIQARISALVFDKSGNYVFEQSGRYIATELKPLIDQVRSMLEKDQGSWDPETAAAVWFSLANAFSLYGEQQDGTALKESAADYDRALQYWTQQRAPADWARAKNNLGNVLWLLGERASGTKELDAAIDDFDEALTVRTSESSLFDWATTQNDLGIALALLGDRKPDPLKLDASIVALNKAQQVWTQDAFPLLWARTQNNLGNVQMLLGRRENETKRFEAAAAAYREALKVWREDQVPIDWARAENNLGTALEIIGDRRWRARELTEAVDAFTEAQKEWRRDRVPLDWANIQENLAKTNLLLFKIMHQPSYLDRARKNCEDALSEFSAAKLQDRVDGLEFLLQQIEQAKN